MLEKFVSRESYVSCHDGLLDKICHELPTRVPRQPSWSAFSSLSPNTTFPIPNFNLQMELSSSLGGISVRTVRDAHLPAMDPSTGVSQHSSPSSALPSPPDSPGSISSSPSFSSSFFFSSVAASPRHNQTHMEQDREPAQGLIIPSLTLPAALRQPTIYGKTVGDVRILVFGSADPGASSVVGMLLEDNEDVVDVMPSEVTHNGHVVRASTDWAEHRDAHGLEKFEPTHNVEIIDISKHASADEVRLIVITWQTDI